VVDVVRGHLELCGIATAAALSIMTTLPDDDIEQLSAVDLPAEHVEDYFALRLARPDDHTVVIGSTGFGDLPWQPLPPESVTAVALTDLSVTSVPLVAD